MSKMIHYFLAVSIGFLSGAVFVLKTLPDKPKEIICESGMEVETGRQYELWTSECTYDTIYGEKITVTMID